MKDKDEPLTEKKEEKKAENVIPEIKKAKEFFHDVEEFDNKLKDLSPDWGKRNYSKDYKPKKLITQISKRTLKLKNIN